jgi:hypothetical protein
VGTDESSDEILGLLPQWESPVDLVPGTEGPPAGSPRFQQPEDSRTGGRFGRSIRRQGRDDPRTPTSSIGDVPVRKPDVKEIVPLVIGLLGLVVAGGTWVVRRRTGRKLRQPTKDHTRAVAEPLARIMSRHADVSLLGPDLADIIAAGAAAGAWLNDGPLLEGPAVDPGLPVDLNPMEDQL